VTSDAARDINCYRRAEFIQLLRLSVASVEQQIRQHFFNAPVLCAGRNDLSELVE
jgi:hypothetical protein